MVKELSDIIHEQARTASREPTEVVLRAWKRANAENSLKTNWKLDHFSCYLAKYIIKRRVAGHEK